MNEMEVYIMAHRKLSGPLAHTADSNWVALGWYFGYPECCIQSFIELRHMQVSLELKRDRQLFGTGYVVCDTCNETKDIHDLLNFIIDHRHPSAPPFPRQGKVLSEMDAIMAEFVAAHREQNGDGS